MHHLDVCWQEKEAVREEDRHEAHEAARHRQEGAQEDPKWRGRQALQG